MGLHFTFYILTHRPPPPQLTITRGSNNWRRGSPVLWLLLLVSPLSLSSTDHILHMSQTEINPHFSRPCCTPDRGGRIDNLCHETLESNAASKFETFRRRRTTTFAAHSLSVSVPPSLSFPLSLSGFGHYVSLYGDPAYSAACLRERSGSAIVRYFIKCKLREFGRKLCMMQSSACREKHDLKFLALKDRYE